jgi:hypothetical protein
MSADTIFGFLFVKNPEASFFLLLWNQLIIVQILPVTLFRELIPAF